MSAKIEQLAAALSCEEIHPAAPPVTTLTAAAMVGAAFALVLTIAYLGVRPDLAAALTGHDHVIFAKLLFALGVIAAALPVLLDLSIPGRRPGGKMLIVFIPFAAIAIFAGLEVIMLPVREWLHPIEHGSWFECLWKIPALSVPAFAVLALALRRQAPTSLVRTGAYLGLASGGIGMLGYALHCHDDSVTFVAIAYSLAVLMMAIFGAVIGPRVLHWR